MNPAYGCGFAHQSAGTRSVTYHRRQKESHRYQDRLTLEPSVAFTRAFFYVTLPRYFPASLFDLHAKTCCFPAW